MKNLQELDRFYWEKRSKKNLRRLRKKRKTRERRFRSHSGGESDRVLSHKEMKAIQRIVGMEMDGANLSDSSDRTPVPRKKIALPEKFSIIDEPLKCLKTLQGFKALFEDARIEGVLISHENTTEHDLGAEILLGKVAKGCMDFHESQGYRFLIEGKYPDSPGLRRLIRSVGIVKELDIHDHAIKSSSHENSKVRIFERKSGLDHDAAIGSLDFKTRATQAFVEHIDQCLKENGSKLTLAATQELAEYIGEIITNAQDHSGDPNWQIYGYLDKDHENRVCEVVIFNYGHTISETFKNLPKEDFARKELNKYLQQHEKTGVFRMGWSTDSLTNLFALQGSVSSKNKPSDSTRGHGSISLIEFFQSISDKSDSAPPASTKMCVLSGSEHIRFDGKYRLEEELGRPPIIAFNETNDLKKLPDNNYVTKLDGVFFPGTLIAIQFILPEIAVKEINHGEEEYYN